jgi:DNA-binding NarL/FixJ family response regulator
VTLIAAEPALTLVATASDGREAVARAREHAPDLIIMDISMPQLDGIAATIQARQEMPAAKVLGLSTYREWSYVEAMLRAGAAGYVLKHSAPVALVPAVQAILAGETYLDPALGPRPAAPLAALTHPVPEVVLSDTERAILQLVAQSYSNREVAQQLTLSPAAVVALRAQAMEKLGLRDRVALVRYAVAKGWLG